MSMRVIIGGSDEEQDAIASLVLEIDEVEREMVEFVENDSPAVGVQGGTEEEQAELSNKIVEVVNSSSFLSGKIRNE